MPTLIMGTDHVVTLSDLANSLSDAPIVDAQVTLTLTHADNSPVGGVVWPQTAVHDAAAPGTYRAALPAGAQLTANQRVYAVLEASTQDGLKRTWRIPLRPESISA
jgi:hypothetical protein